MQAFDQRCLAYQALSAAWSFLLAFSRLTPIPKSPSYFGIPFRKSGRRPSSRTAEAGCGESGFVVRGFLRADQRCDRVRRSAASIVEAHPRTFPASLRTRVRWTRRKGKAIIPIFGISLDPHPNHLYDARIPSHQEGRLAIVTKRGAGCGGRGSADNERH
jgi:hypothetical protein